jgi:hypothetical protein
LRTMEDRHLLPASIYSTFSQVLLTF